MSFCEQGNETARFMKIRKCLYQPGRPWFLKKDPALHVGVSAILLGLRLLTTSVKWQEVRLPKLMVRGSSVLKISIRNKIVKILPTLCETCGKTQTPLLWIWSTQILLSCHSLCSVYLCFGNIFYFCMLRGIADKRNKWAQCFYSENTVINDTSFRLHL